MIINFPSKPYNLQKLANLISYIKHKHLFAFLVNRTTAGEPVGKNSITEVPLEDNETYQASGWTRGDIMYQNNLSASSPVASSLKFHKRRSSEGNQGLIISI